VRYILFLIILGVPIILSGQGIDLTGRISFRVQSLSYDENSDIKPDSVSNDAYGKTTLAPGLSQFLNVALFGRTRTMDLTLLADLKNNEWNRLAVRNLNQLSRFTLNMRISNHEIILGDFFESRGESFLYSRQFRGAKYQVNTDNVFGNNTFLNFLAVGGIVQPGITIGDHLQDLFKQYETAGQYQRYLASGIFRTGFNGTADLAVKYLWAKDDSSSIDESINEPIANRVFGGDINFYFWERNVRLFAEYLISEKDTLINETDPVNTQNVRDNSYKAGVDFNYNTLKMILFLQRFGFNYYTAGYPFLETDREGLRGQLAYAVPQTVSIYSDFEHYKNNLDNFTYFPTTNTDILDVGATTMIPDWPEITLVVGLRKDLSNEIIDSDEQLTKIDKLTSKLEGRIGLTLTSARFSLSTIYQDLDDKSILPTGEPLGTSQLISAFNFYTSSSQHFFITAGAVYSDLKMTNNQKNINLYLYESNRWDIIPRLLTMEANISYIANKANGGGIQDKLGNYDHLNIELSLEYFFNNHISLKTILGTDSRKFRYSTDEALQIISDPQYGPSYFNGNESYNGLILGGEFNWIF